MQPKIIEQLFVGKKNKRIRVDVVCSYCKKRLLILYFKEAWLGIEGIEFNSCPHFVWLRFPLKCLHRSWEKDPVCEPFRKLNFEGKIVYEHDEYELAKGYYVLIAREDLKEIDLRPKQVTLDYFFR